MIQTATHHAAAAITTSTSLFGYVMVPLPDYILIPLTGTIVALAGVLITALFHRRRETLRHTSVPRDSRRFSLSG